MKLLAGVAEVSEGGWLDGWMAGWIGKVSDSLLGKVIHFPGTIDCRTGLVTIYDVASSHTT